MVITQKDIEDSLTEALKVQTKSITEQIDASISTIRNEIINIFKDENKKLNERISLLENKNDQLENRISQLETKLEGKLQ